MTYEDIQRADLGLCAEVYVRVFNQSPWNEEWSLSTAVTRLTEIHDTPGFLGMKIVVDDCIMGFVMGYMETYESGQDYYLKEMCVLSNKQRQGLGASLLLALKDHLAQIGARKLYLLTARSGVAADFYMKNGFYTSDKMIMMGCWLTPQE